MDVPNRLLKSMPFAGLLLLFSFGLIGCGLQDERTMLAEGENPPVVKAEALALPALQSVPLDGRPLRVVTTTSIISDVVGQVGGDAIELTSLMGPGQDPHSYVPAARDLTTVSEAEVIFVNGWELEEALIEELEQISEDTQLVPISARITPLRLNDDAHAGEQDEEDEHDHHYQSADPHVWFDVENVRQWVRNTERILSELDPANAETFRQNASAYLIELADLEAYAQAQLASIPEDRRILVTNHASLNYFARRYGFEVLGTVLPATSTLAEPSASELSELIRAMEEHQVCAIFSETTVSDTLARTVAGELTRCDEVKVLQLYTGALGLPGSGADDFLGMFKANVDTIVEGLR
jgi:ABC-type Zn uptake system ZnuABC Zn-binding protein ZnuA